MVLTPSTMVALGTPAPDFELKDVVTGKIFSRTALHGRPFLVMFICRHCPYVQHVQHELAAIGRDVAKKVGVVAISSNDAENYPEDAPDSLKQFAEKEKFVFPLGYDASQKVAKDYRAACTPDFFVYDGHSRLFYRGQLDDSRPGNGKAVTGADLRRALDLVAAGKVWEGPQKPSIGCNIKWKKGNEPR